MSRKSKEFEQRPGRGKVKLPPFIAFPYATVNSKAYANLTGSAVKALIVCLGKPKLPYNDAFYLKTTWTFPYREAERLGISAGTFSRCIKELEQAGFIEIVSPGLAFEDMRRATVYRLSDRWENPPQKLRIASKTERPHSNSGAKPLPGVNDIAPIMESRGP